MGQLSIQKRNCLLSGLLYCSTIRPMVLNSLTRIVFNIMGKKLPCFHCGQYNRVLLQDSFWRFALQTLNLNLYLLRTEIPSFPFCTRAAWQYFPSSFIVGSLRSLLLYHDWPEAISLFFNHIVQVLQVQSLKVSKFNLFKTSRILSDHLE
jgi:hypothetical protein